MGKNLPSPTYKLSGRAVSDLAKRARRRTSSSSAVVTMKVLQTTGITKNFPVSHRRQQQLYKNKEI